MELFVFICRSLWISRVPVWYDKCALAHAHSKWIPQMSILLFMFFKNQNCLCKIVQKLWQFWKFFKGMIFLLASLSFILELLREADLFIISGILFFIVVIVLVQDQPAVFSAKWFLISFCSFMLILLNTVPFLQEYHQNNWNVDQKR